ncbi:MAG: PAS domain S-box protein [Roseovarius sp.]
MQIDVQDSALLDAIFEAAVDAIIVSDAAGQIIRTNPAACDLFQYEPDQLAGQNVSMIMPSAIAHAHDDYMRHHIQTGESRIIGKGRELEGLRKDQSVFPLHLSIGRTEVAGKTLFVAILHDLTRHKAAEAALARSQRLEAIGQMTGGIAHDFNNLLTVVIGNLELLEMRGVSDAQKELVDEALSSAELGAELTTRLTVFARKGNLKPEKADLKTLCENTISILRRTLGTSYHISTEFESDLYEVMLDPAQFQSALMNLALNARDAMGHKGELLISVSNATIDDTYIAQETDINPGTYVRLSVSDNGAGMSEDAQKRAFEPFFTTKSDSGGTGLGLAMVYGFVRQSGGHITLYSEIGLGSSFGLYFPALVNDSRGTDPVTGGSQGTLIDAQNGSVLIVEDNAKVRRLSLQRVRDLGFVAHEAETGDHAYQMLQDGLKPDIVFTDVVMPGNMNGYDLAAKVAAEYPHIKVLLTSGYASDVMTASMARDQRFDILHKPYRQADLARRLQALLAGGETDG